MSTQHTPGPWNCHAHDWKGLSAGIVRDKNNDPIADCRYTELPRDRKPAEVVDANTHLIAAAPNLRNELEDSDALLAELSQYVASEFVERIAEQRKRNLDTLDRAEGVTQ